MKSMKSVLANTVSSIVRSVKSVKKPVNVIDVQVSAFKFRGNEGSIKPLKLVGIDGNGKLVYGM